MTGPYDVIVVGGRVAGASTALLLARAGARVALLTRSSYGSDTVSTHGLMRAGVLQLSRWGVLPEVVAAGTPPVRRTLFHYADGETVQVSIRPSRGVDALYAPRRHVIDRIVVDAAADAGVDVRHEVTVTDLLHDDNGRVSGVSALDRDGRASQLTARLTVGADGVRSDVASLLGAPILRSGSAASAVLYRYYAGLDGAGYEWAYGDGAGAGVIPTNDGLACLFVATTPVRMRAARREGVEAAFAGVLGRAAPGLVDRVRSADAVGRLHGWGGVAGFVRQSWGRGWALVGDAGYFKDPITTHGMTDALRDAELLANAVLAAQSGSAAESVALARYQTTRDRLSRQLFDVTESVASYDWDLQEIRTLLRRVSSAMSDEIDHLQALPDRPWASDPLAELRPGTRAAASIP
jgi:2-polyprenyl-6-methoxyphenol hydroxylase-like FAD-dependent oxidoreductase